MKRNIVLISQRILLSAGLIVIFFILGAAFGAVFFSTHSTTTTTSSSATFYELDFTQQGQCSPAYYAASWEVVLNGSTTVIEPSGGEIATNGSFVASPSYENYSLIAFAVANGLYSYNVNGLGRNLTGIATVSNSDTTVTVAAIIFCTTNPNSTTK